MLTLGTPVLPLSLALLAAQKHVTIKKVKKISINFIKKYNNSGLISKRI